MLHEFLLDYEYIDNVATAVIPLVHVLTVVHLLQSLKVIANLSEWAALPGWGAQSQGLEGLPSMPLEYHWTPT